VAAAFPLRDRRWAAVQRPVRGGRVARPGKRQVGRGCARRQRRHRLPCL